MEFLRSFLTRNFAGKPLVASQNFGCFLNGQSLNSVIRETKPHRRRKKNTSRDTIVTHLITRMYHLL